MKKQLLRHIEILKTIPEIKQSIEELKFGCEVFIQNYITSVVIIGDNRGLCITEGTEYEEFLGQTGTHTQVFSEKHISEIIGQVEERHLRMFMKKQDRRLIIDEGSINTTWVGISSNGWSTIDKLDNSKSYMNQSEEFFEKLNNWMIKEFKIKL